MLAEKGHQVWYAGLYPARQNILFAKGAENVDLNGKRKKLNPHLVADLIKLIKKIKPDIVQANGSDTLRYAVFAKIFLPGINILYRNISMVSSWVAPGSIKHKFNKFLFKRVSRVTSVGEQAMNDLVKTYGFPKDKIMIIRRGVPKLEFNHDRSRKSLEAEFGFLPHDFILCHIGHFSAEKNHAFLVDSFEKIFHADGNAKLLLIGEGALSGSIKHMVNQKKLNSAVVFAGYRGNVQEILSGCDLFLLCSTVEGVPGVVIEAALQQIPTVAIQAGGTGEVIKNEQTGILLEGYDKNIFAKAVLSLLKNDGLRKTLGENARSFVLENYTMEGALKQFEIIYNEMLKEKIERAA